MTRTSLWSVTLKVEDIALICTLIPANNKTQNVSQYLGLHTNYISALTCRFGCSQS